MLKDYIIFKAACCPRGSLSLHIRLMPQEDYNKMIPSNLCDKVSEILLQPRGVTFKEAQSLCEKHTRKLRERAVWPC